MSLRDVSRRLFPYVLVATAGFTIAYLIVFFFIFPSDVVPDERKVPNVVGIDYDLAVQRLKEAGFTAQEGSKRNHVSAPPQAVLAQIPVAGSIEQKGASVVLDVSAGQRKGEVPSVVGMTGQEAQVAVENAGLEVQEVRETPSDRPRGEVITVAPNAGDQVPAGSGVVITVSAGPATVKVPDLVGRPLADARSTLEQIGLVPGRVTTDSTSLEPSNTVVGQSPTSGRAVRSGSRVSLTIAP
jgi:eukaryotic-like serine/threonine-protein kinase